MQCKLHVRFGGRAGETGRLKSRHRAPVRPYTYLRSWEGRCFFAFVLDVFSRKIVGWQFSRSMRTDLVLDALRMALALRSPGADFTLIQHTDHGVQYASSDYRQQLKDAKVLASMGTVGDAYDNAMAETLVDSYKTELVADRAWRTTSELELATVEWVGWYNSARLHSALGYRTPEEVEAEWHATNPGTRAEAAGTAADASGARASSPQPSRNPAGGEEPVRLLMDVSRDTCPAKTAPDEAVDEPAPAGLSTATAPIDTHTQKTS